LGRLAQRACRAAVQRQRLIFFVEGFAALFFTAAVFRRGAVFSADFFAVMILGGTESY
jgi:hypothetical protein